MSNPQICIGIALLLSELFTKEDIEDVCIAAKNGECDELTSAVFDGRASANSTRYQ